MCTLLDPTSIAEEQSSFQAAVSALASSVGLEDSFRLQALSGGANNRVYCLEKAGPRALLKSYFRHPDDPRDRLASEFAFLRFAWNRGVRCVPEPLAFDAEHGLGLYEFIPGTAIVANEIESTDVDQAAQLFVELNNHGADPLAGQLPLASEACFSLESHTQQVNRRVQRLQSEARAKDPDIDRFIQQELPETWQHVEAALREQTHLRQLSWDAVLAPAERCLSPSDFGFHNALRRPAGRLCFLDFEYAGWDDPAKMICDFFCQPAVPLPPKWRCRFIESVTTPFSDKQKLRERVQLLLPLYYVKWCCIVLNTCLPEGRARRSFAGAVSQTAADREAGMLERARQLLERVTTPLVEPGEDVFLGKERIWERC